MKLLLVAAAFIATAIAARYADAAPKRAHKPSVCADFEVSKSKAGDIGICYDNAKPAVYRTFALVDMPGDDGKQVRVMVGWR